MLEVEKKENPLLRKREQKEEEKTKKEKQKEKGNMEGNPPKGEENLREENNFF